MRMNISEFINNMVTSHDRFPSDLFMLYSTAVMWMSGLPLLSFSLRIMVIQVEHENAKRHADFSLFMSIEMQCLGQKNILHLGLSGPHILKIDIQFGIGESDDDLNHLVALHTVHPYLWYSGFRMASVLKVSVTYL